MSNELLPAYTQKATKEFLVANGASGTIYALAFPESRQILEEVIDGGNRKEIIRSALAAIFAEKSAPAQDDIAREIERVLAIARTEYTGIFDGAWTSRQDAVDQHFFEAWKKWSAPVVNLPEELQKFSYPTAGASEGLRETINQHAISHPGSPVHVFHGEYEGFRSYAEAAGKMEVVFHDRDNWKSSLHRIAPGDKFYISQPSAIDGNVWDGFDDFAKALHAQQPQADIMLDLSYVGAVAKDYKINADHPNIATVFFSLSKPFGVYYHRIGGMFSRNEYDSLIGNKWFKILQSLQVGTALLERSTVFDLPRKYKPVQEAAIASVNQRLGLSLKSSDVILFGTGEATDANDPVQKTLLRGAAGKQFLRLCVTPEMVRNIPGAKFIEMDASPIPIPLAANGPRIAEM